MDIWGILELWDDIREWPGWQGMDTNDYVAIGLLVIGTSFLAEIPISKWRSRKKAKDVSKPARPLGKSSSEQYVSPDHSGTVSFDYSNNDGKYRIGHGEQMFKTKWGRRGENDIYLYKDPVSLGTIAVTDKRAIGEIDDASVYDGSSNNRILTVGEISVLRNAHGFWAAVRIINIENKNMGSDHDELTFEYVIQTNGTPSFTGVTPPTKQERQTEKPGSSAPSTGPEQETQGKVQEDPSPPPYPVSYTWLESKEAYMLIRTSTLVSPLPASFEDIENPDWEDIQDHKESKADVIASMHLGDFNLECPDAVRDGKYGLQTLRWWIGKKIEEQDS